MCSSFNNLKKIENFYYTLFYFSENELKIQTCQNIWHLNSFPQQVSDNVHITR